MSLSPPVPSSVRSPSLPGPTEHLSVCTNTRRDSTAMHSEGPITPPMSPHPSDDGEDRPDIEIDPQPRWSGPGGPAPMPEETPSIADSMDLETVETAVSEEEGPKPPLRLLEDEKSHVNKSGGVRLTDFEVKGTLGTGTFGRVLLVRLRSTSARESQNFFALKVLRKTEIVKLRQVEHVNAERYILSRTRHPFVVDLFATFQDSRNIYMLLSYVPGGELFTHLRRARRFTPDVTRFYLATIVLALRYLHSFNIIYRDLKPENLLLDARGYVRLTDFGFAKIVDDRTWTLCGTPEYLAPEIVMSDGHGKAADWWACGILAYEMMVGYPPFFDTTPVGIYNKIMYTDARWPREIDNGSIQFVNQLLVKDKTKRLGNMGGGPEDVLNHPWFRGVDWDALERREIRAPIIPQVTSGGDMRHFLHLPHPPAEEIPGLVRQESPPTLHQRFDPVSYSFQEF